MCSTPRPKRKIKSASTGTVSGTMLSNLSAQNRADFVKRANSADDRRHQIQQQIAEKKQALSFVGHNVKKVIKNKKVSTKNWSYWLVDASIKEIFMMLFLGKPYKH
ncbi:MAG: hypothetical protein JKX78_06780 [Alteromonadaceae bacterium]|nr:hypothetical protein [Alteromonadaceae bacterium]